MKIPSGLNLNTPAVFLFSGLSLSGCIRDRPVKPNILVILTDDQTYRAIGYNNDRVKTPNLDKLARQGIIFDRAYTASPVCVASRACLLTGLFPQANGTVALNTGSFIKNISEGKRYATLPRLLDSAGYSTYFSGKSHLGDPKNYGFKSGEESFDFDDKSTFKDAHDFIDDPGFGQKPFLLWLAVRQPHVPLKPAEKWIDLYSDIIFSPEKNFLESPPLESFYNQGLPGENFYRDCDYTDNYKNLPSGPPRSAEVISEFTKAYYATISHLDFQIGELLEHLKSKKKLENTVIIFLSDNGYFLGNHGLGNKLTMHEESVHIPMFICWDKLPRVNVHSDALVCSVDILPTILSLTGAESPAGIQGHSLVPLFSDPTSTINKYVFSESVGVGGELGSGHRMALCGNWKYILSDTGDEALFNLEDDLYELDNRIMDKSLHEEVLKLKKALNQWKSLTGDKKLIPGGEAR